MKDRTKKEQAVASIRSALDLVQAGAWKVAPGEMELVCEDLEKALELCKERWAELVVAEEVLRG